MEIKEKHTRKGINGTNIGTYAKAMESIQFNMATKKNHHNWVLGDIGCISHPLTLGSFLALPYKNCLPGKMPYSTLYFVMALQLLDHVLRELFQRTLQTCSKESRQTLQF